MGEILLQIDNGINTQWINALLIPDFEVKFLSLFSSLSIQLIRECKEVLKGAALVKQYYKFMVNAVIWDEEEAEAKFERDLIEFDEDMKSMLDVSIWISPSPSFTG